MKSYVFKALCCAGIIAAAVSCGGGKKKAAEAAKAQADSIARADSIEKAELARKAAADAEALIPQLADEPVFDIETSLGTIKVKLYKDTPLHRANFEKLALTHYYDGLQFHRVIDGFMIQGGDPNSRDTTAAGHKIYGQGGPDYTIPAEFVPAYTHKKGALCAARRGDAANPKKESSGSQFYLVQDENACASLNGDYTVFGETVEGLEVIDKIAKVPVDNRDCPLNPVFIKSVKLDPASMPKPAEPADSAAAPEAAPEAAK
jgi:cyclophilin family peptidyl-prolyl cis-trans isomerase